MFEGEARRAEVRGAESALLGCGDGSAIGGGARRRAGRLLLDLSVEIVELLLLQHGIAVALEGVEEGVEALLGGILGGLLVLLQLLAHVVRRLGLL